MTINDLVQLMENRLATLQSIKSQAYISGDLDGINKADLEIGTTTATLNQLKAAASVNNIN